MNKLCAQLLVPTILLVGFSLITTNTTAQICENQCLAFKGSTFTSPNGDFIERSPSPVSGNSNFTVEGWFLSTGGPLGGQAFRRLFSLSGTTRFEIGENGNNLVLFWNDATPASSFNVLVPVSTSAWHHLAVVRSGATVQIYLDGNPLAPLTGLGVLNTTVFRVGHWGGGQTPTQDWEGQVDEIRLWNYARTATQIQDAKDCTLTNTIPLPGLLINWHLNQNMTPDGPNPGATAIDFSGNGNHGNLVNFSLTSVNPLSNFVCNLCPPFLNLDITDLGSQSISLVAICDGTGVHFCVNHNGSQALGLAGAAVAWEYFDVGVSTAWTPLTSLTGLCFGVPPGDPALSINCANSTTGYVDRKFRAVITKGTPPQTCTYMTPDYLAPLRIYCPVTNATIALNPPLPSPPNVALCDGSTYSTTVSITSNHPYVTLPAIPPAGDLSIQWCINGFPILPLDNLVSFPFNSTAFFPDLCFEAKIHNGVCPLYATKVCIPVDKQPMCGTIDAQPEPALTQDPNGGQYDYWLCPGNDVDLVMLNPADFKNCNAMWQFMFPSQGVWIDLNGFGNSTQNTNTLPQLSPPNPFSPQAWPPGETMILYRIECRPLHWPYSDCAPCHSNIVKITLKPQKPAPVITAAQNPICKGGTTTITVSPYDPNCTYNWYCNGILVGHGQSINATQPACYWVEVYDGCYKQTSQPLILQVCEIVPVIECPQDNPCACLGVPITLVGCSSYSTCGSTGLTYSWTASNGGPCTPGSNGPCECVHTPDAAGTTYTLTVTDPNTSCTASKQITITPCQ
ncbi:MAG: LamG domain-containing protein [Saprospirales bacterium]|nr:LamG domain-containing protein [Saprospirales bacterium]